MLCGCQSLYRPIPLLSERDKAPPGSDYETLHSGLYTGVGICFRASGFVSFEISKQSLACLYRGLNNYLYYLWGFLIIIIGAKATRVNPALPMKRRPAVTQPEAADTAFTR